MTRNLFFGFRPFSLIPLDADTGQPLDKSPSQKTYVTYYDVKKDKQGRKSIIAHKSPLGSAAAGKPAAEDKKEKQGNGKKKGKDDDEKKDDQKGDQNEGKKGGKSKQKNNDEKKDGGKDNQNDQKKKGDEGDKNPQNREWTTEDDDKLKELWAANTPLKQIAKQLKRPQKQCEDRYNEISGGGGDDKDKKGGNNKKAEDSGEQPKLTKAQKKAARKAAEEADATAKPKDDKKEEVKTKKTASKAPSTRTNGEARFTMGEWLTLQEDSLFSFGELQCLSEIIMKDQKQTWTRIAARFYDLTGRRVHPDDIREKFEGMAGTG